jgi:hypothetical protein
MAAVIFTVDASTATGRPALSSEDIAAEAAGHADVLIPFGSVDPHRGPDAIGQARRLVREHGVRGFKFHPSLQAFSPDDERFRPLWGTPGRSWVWPDGGMIASPGAATTARSEKRSAIPNCPRWLLPSRYHLMLEWTSGGGAGRPSDRADLVGQVYDGG